MFLGQYQHHGVWRRVARVTTSFRRCDSRFPPTKPHGVTHQNIIVLDVVSKDTSKYFELYILQPSDIRASPPPSKTPSPCWILGSHSGGDTNSGLLGFYAVSLGLGGTRKQGSGENYIMSSLMIWTPHSILFGWSCQEEWDGRGMRHLWGIGEGVYRVLVGKPEWKRLLGRPRHRWENNIKMDLHEVSCGDIDWIDLAQDGDRCRALINAVMNLRVP